MNRKLINGLLVATIAIGSAVPMTSCKDTDEDLYAQLRDDNSTLGARIDADIEALKQAQQALKTAQEKCKQDCEKAWADFKETGFEECLNAYVKAKGKHDTLKWYLDQIDGALKAADGTTYNSIGDRFAALELTLSTLKSTNITEIPGLADVAELLKKWNTDLPTVLTEAHTAAAVAAENEAILKALLEGYTDEEGKIDITKIKGLMKQAVEDAAKAKSDAATALTTAQSALSTATEAKTTADAAKEIADKAAEDLIKLEKRVKANETSIKKINSQLKAITGQLNHLVTGIVLQQVNNPVFGKLNLPLDVNSKMLIAYYGDAINVNFPPVSSSTTEYDSKSIVITDADKSRLGGIDTKNFNGVLHADYGEDNVKLGSVYLSVNPAGLDVEGANWNLVNSKGETSAITLSGLEKSTDELMFGYGRAEGDVPNGFYVTDATVPVTSIDEVKLTLDDNFKDNVESLLESRSLSDIAEVAKLIANQFNNKVPARGIRADWEYETETLDENGDVVSTETVKDATYSEFGLAATTFKPLSYKFLYGKHFKPLGTISPIDEFTLDSKLNITMPTFNFKLDNVNLGFTFGTITVSLDGAEIVVNIPQTPVYDNNGIQIGYIQPDPIRVTDFANLENQISQSITTQLQGQSAQINQKFKEAMASVAQQINEEINKEMTKLKTNIEGQFDKIITEIQDKVNGYLGTVNGYVDKVNGFLNRINRLLEDPNHYLQVTMLYSGNNGAFHQVSNSETMPTAFVLNGGDAVKLCPTSYTGDMIVPSFRKYVAVTNVYDTKTKVTNTTLLTDANSAKFMNEVIPGTQNEVALKLTAGYTYEIVYSSLDYHGVTSTRKFYISAE